MKKDHKFILRRQESKFFSEFCTFLIDLHNYKLSRQSEGITSCMSMEEFEQLCKYADKLDDIITGIQMGLKIKQMEKDKAIANMKELINEHKTN